MKRMAVVLVGVVGWALCAFAQETPVPAVALKPKVMLLIAEQNIEGPQHAWWASEVDLSATEAEVASRLIGAGYTVIEPSAAGKALSQKPAFRVIGISENDTRQLADRSQADYVVSGKALASAGGTVAQSSMRSCYANISARLIRVKDGAVLAYLNASGSSAHTDTITGGREALQKAGTDLALKIIEALSQGGMKK